MIPKPDYIISEPYMSYHRVLLGFDTMEKATAAHEAIAASTCGTDGEAGSLLPIPPTTQERIAQLEALVSEFAAVCDAEVYPSDSDTSKLAVRVGLLRRARALIDHREER